MQRMKDLFKNASSYWVRYSRYEWKKDRNNKYYIMPAPNAQPIVYDPLQDYKSLVLDALNVGRLIRKESSRKGREAIMGFVSQYGLLGIMTALPTTPKFLDYEAVYLPTNHFLREEVMRTETYLAYFFPNEMLDFHKRGKEHVWHIPQDKAMMALFMTFRREPEAQIMCFMRNYGERYDWLVQVFRDWSFTHLASYLYYLDKDRMDETTLDLYRMGMSAFEGIAPEYHMELRERPTIVWDFHSLLLAIQMMFSFMLADETFSLKLCPNCFKAFFTENDDKFCGLECAQENEREHCCGRTGV